MRHWLVAAIAVLLLSTTCPGEEKRYYAHAAVEDQHGVIAPWYRGQNGQMDLRVRIAAETLKRYPWTEPGQAAAPAPHYLYNGQWQIADDGTISIPLQSSPALHVGKIPAQQWRNGDLIQRTAQIVFAMEEYYRYSGDPYAFGQVQLAANYVLKHCLTPADHPWPRFAVGCPTRGELYRDCDPRGFIQLDIVAEMGVALVHAYKLTGNREYLETAMHWGKLFANKRNSQEGQPPWPRYANPEDVPWGNRPNGNVMTGGVSFVLAFLEELIALDEVTEKQQLIAARDAGEKYLRDDLLPRWVENPTWGFNYWDNLAAYSNQNVIYWTVRYLIAHRDRFPNWRADARNLMTIMLNRTSPNPTGKNGVYSGAWVHTESASCCQDTNGYGPQRTCGLFLEYARETGDEWAREVGRRMAILSSYDILENGMVIDGLLSHEALVAKRWFKIAVLNPIVYFINNMSLLPEHLAPNRENHLLQASSTVKSIRYGDGDIEYQTFAAPKGGVDLLRLAFEPQSVQADGSQLEERQTLDANGYSVQKLPGGDALLRIRHDALTRIRVRGDDPQVVIANSLVSAERGASTSVTFEGNQVRVVGRCAPDGGLADVYLDGEKLASPIDCWSPNEMDQQILFTRSGLPDGEHTIKVIARGNGNPAAKGSALRLDAVQYSVARGESGMGEGAGSAGAQRVIFGYPKQEDYVDSKGHRWRAATEVLCPTGVRVDSVAKHWWTDPHAAKIEGAADPELYRYGMHGTQLVAYFTVAPTRAYDVRIHLAETRRGGDVDGTMTVHVNGKAIAERLNVEAKAGGVDRAFELLAERIAARNGVIEVRFVEEVEKEAFVNAVEVLPAK